MSSLNLNEHTLAVNVVNAVGDREVVCLKGYIVKGTGDAIKFFLKLEDPSRYLLIPKEDIYYKTDSEDVPFKGQIIWASPKNIRRIEADKPQGKVGPIQKLWICPICKFYNTKPGEYVCAQCGYKIIF